MIKRYKSAKMGDRDEIHGEKIAAASRDQFFSTPSGQRPWSWWEVEQKGDLNATTKTVGSPFVSTMG